MSFCSVLLRDILVNIGSGFLGSLIFIYFVLWLYKPRIQIGKCIAKRKDDFDQIGETYYAFKLRNKSLFKAFDLNVQLYEVISYPADDGKRNTRHKLLKLKTNQFTYIGKCKSSWIDPNYCENSLIFRSYEDLTAILNDNMKSLQLEVTLRHGLTGISGIYIKEFISGSIQKGRFKAGKNFDIIPGE